MEFHVKRKDGMYMSEDRRDDPEDTIKPSDEAVVSSRQQQREGHKKRRVYERSGKDIEEGYRWMFVSDFSPVKRIMGEHVTAANGETMFQEVYLNLQSTHQSSKKRVRALREMGLKIIIFTEIS